MAQIGAAKDTIMVVNGTYSKILLTNLLDLGLAVLNEDLKVGDDFLLLILVENGLNCRSQLGLILGRDESEDVGFFLEG